MLLALLVSRKNGSLKNTEAQKIIGVSSYLTKIKKFPTAQGTISNRWRLSEACLDHSQTGTYGGTCSVVTAVHAWYLQSSSLPYRRVNDLDPSCRELSTKLRKTSLSKNERLSQPEVLIISMTSECLFYILFW